jgi:ribosome-binding factor A
MSIRDERLNEALREAAAAFLVREASPQSLVTVTRAEVHEGGKSGVIYVSVLPESMEDQAVAFANRHRTEFGKFFETRVRGAHMPHVEFVVDLGEKNRRRLDELSNQ